MFGILKNKISNLIKIASVALIRDDSDNFPKTSISYNYKESKVARFSPYGIDSQPPVGSLSLSFAINGDESNQIAISQDIINRMRNLEEGEVVIHNTKSGAYTFYKKNGNIEIVSKNDISIEAPGNETKNITGNKSNTIGGSDTESISGSKSITASSMTITAPTIVLNGNVTIAGSFSQTGGGSASFSGNVTSSGSITSTGDMVAQGTSLHNHTHSDPQGGNTGPPN